MASRVVSRRYDLAIEATGLNDTQYVILRNIMLYQPVSQMRLAEHLGMERTTLYRSLDILEKKGWVKIQPAPEGPAKILELTSKGRNLTRKAQAAWSGVHQNFLAEFGADRWEDFTVMLDDVLKHFKTPL